MTKKEAEKAIKENGSIRAAAKSLNIPESTFGDRIKKMGIVKPKPKRETCSRIDSVKQQTISGGFTLGNSRVSDRRPNDSLKGKIYKLKRGMAYPVDELARQWAANPDTIRRHAKDVGAFLYVETNPEEWTACVLHPETAEEHR